MYFDSMAPWRRVAHGRTSRRAGGAVGELQKMNGTGGAIKGSLHGKDFSVNQSCNSGGGKQPFLAYTEHARNLLCT